MQTTQAKIQHDYPLARFTTVRTGGNAEFFSRASSVAELHELLSWAQEQKAAINVVGSGSNLLVADEGVAGLVIKLEKDLARIERSGDTQLVCGGGARLPSVAAYAARAGLGGIEFGVNIPGTVGGAVKMNANAYEGQLGDVLSWVQVVTAKGVEERLPEAFEFSYRRSNLKQGEIVASACFELQPMDSEKVKTILAEMRTKRHAAQPSGIKTFGSTFKNPTDSRAQGRTAGQLLAAAGCRGLRVGNAKFSDKHANFVENTGDATTAEVVALMAEGKRRVREEFGIELEAEVQVLGNLGSGGCPKCQAPTAPKEGIGEHVTA